MSDQSEYEGGQSVNTCRINGGSHPEVFLNRLFGRVEGQWIVGEKKEMVGRQKIENVSVSHQGALTA